MFQIDVASAAASLPAPAPAGTPGFFTEGNPATGVAPTVVSGDFLNMVMMELLNVVLGAGLAPSKTDHGQLLEALRAMFGGQGLVGQSGYVTLPLGLILQWGSTPIGNGANNVSTGMTWPEPFPNNCFVAFGCSDQGANASWVPMVITMQNRSPQGCTINADTANNAQTIAAGRHVMWLALGN